MWIKYFNLPHSLLPPTRKHGYYHTRTGYASCILLMVRRLCHDIPVPVINGSHDTDSRRLRTLAVGRELVERRLSSGNIY